MTVADIVSDVKKTHSRLRAITGARVDDPVDAAQVAGAQLAELRFLCARLPEDMRARVWMLSVERAR
jgi:hypothetical protein